MSPKDADGVANSVDRGLLSEHADLCLYCLPRPVCPNILDHYGNSKTNFTKPDIQADKWDLTTF